MEFSENSRYLVIFTSALVVVVAGASLYFYNYQFNDLEPLSPMEQPEIEASYDSENKELELEIIDGRFTNLRSSYVKFEHNGTDTFNIESSGVEKETSYWAKDGLLALNSEGLNRFPLRPGATVTVEMEVPRLLMIRTIADGQEVTSHYVIFEDCEPEVHSAMYMDWDNEEEWIKANQPQKC